MQEQMLNASRFQFRLMFAQCCDYLFPIHPRILPDSSSINQVGLFASSAGRKSRVRGFSVRSHFSPFFTFFTYSESLRHGFFWRRHSKVDSLSWPVHT